VLPILNHYNPIGSTAHVFGHTSKKTWPTKKSHINLVVADTDTWEQIAAKTLEKIKAVELRQERLSRFRDSVHRRRWKGNTSPTTSSACEPQREAALILEITGFSKDKALKRWAVNGAGCRRSITRGASLA
jgi:type III restriction enzyme